MFGRTICVFVRWLSPIAEWCSHCHKHRGVPFVMPCMAGGRLNGRQGGAGNGAAMDISARAFGGSTFLFGVRLGL